MKNCLPIIFAFFTFFLFTSCEKDYDFEPELSLSIDSIEYRGTDYETEIELLSGSSTKPKIYAIERNSVSNEIKYIERSSSIFYLSGDSYSGSDCDYDDEREESCFGSFKTTLEVSASSFSSTQGLRIVSTIAGREAYKDIFMTIYQPEFNLFYLANNKIYQYKSEEEDEVLLLDGDQKSLNLEFISANSSKSRLYFKSSNKVYYIDPSSPDVVVEVFQLPSSAVQDFSTVTNTDDQFYYLYNEEVIVRNDDSELYDYDLSTSSTTYYYNTHADVILLNGYHNVLYNYLGYYSYYSSRTDAIKLKGSSYSSSNIISGYNEDYKELAIAPSGEKVAFTNSSSYLYNILKGTYYSSTWTYSASGSLSSGAYSIDYNNTGDLIFLKSGNIYYTDVSNGDESVLVHNHTAYISEVTW